MTDRIVDFLRRRTEDGPCMVLDLDVGVGLARARARRGGGAPDRFEAEAEGFHEGLRRAFLANAEREPERCLVVDASGDPASIAETLWLVVRARFAALRRPVREPRP